MQPRFQPGEEIRWRGHPRARLSITACVSFWGAALAWFLLVNPDYAAWRLLALPFVIAPWVFREQERRTTYYITTQRAIRHRAKLGPLPPRTRSWHISPGMVKEDIYHLNGTRSLVFEYVSTADADGHDHSPDGFMNLPREQAEEAKALLR